MPSWIRTPLKYIGLGVTAIFVFFVALIFERKRGEADAEARLAKEDRLRRIKEAGAEGDIDALDEEWRER